MNFPDKKNKEKIVSAIRSAEKDTSGEIRVHLEPVCSEDIMDRAAYVFKKLKMHRTEQRNGVLFYLAFLDRKFAVIGDAGINSVVPEDFWRQIKDELTVHFREGKFAEGLEKGILKAGEQLKKYFPDRKNIDELSDEVSSL